MEAPVPTAEESPSLERLVTELLQQVGVLSEEEEEESLRGHDDKSAVVFRRMEQWLELDTATAGAGASTTKTNDGVDDSMITTVEDSAPFSNQIYEKVATMCITAWNPPTTTTTNMRSNVLIQEWQRLQQEPSIQTEEDLVESLSLDCIPAVLVTKWIRQWMECNVDVAPGGNQNQHQQSLMMLNSTNATPKTFSQFLLLGNNKDHDNSDESRKLAPNYAESLIQALFHHMTQLPYYQSQLLLFNQAFQRGDFNNIAKNKSGTSTTQQHGKHTLPQTPKSTTALQDPTQRLHHYQLAQSCAQRLTQQWNHHVSQMEYIVGDWYAVSPPPLRQLGRAGLARVWMKFLTQNGCHTSSATAYAASVRGENTSASGLDASLRILYRILLGQQPHQQQQDTNNDQLHHRYKKSVWEPLLFQQLLFLHKPHAMVLWRDQTALLELYHEPLVQCMAYILKLVPEWIATVCQALVLPSESIWPIGGNTPKQVLLLHEVDTYLGILGNHITSNNNNNDNKEEKNGNDKDISSKTRALLDETTFLSILSTLAQCMASEHSRLAERALTLFRNTYFKLLVHDIYYESSLQVILPVLIRSKATDTAATYAVPWNPTVRKMTFHILKNLQTANPDAFARVANRLFEASNSIISPTNTEETTMEHPKSSLLASKAQPTSPSAAPAFNQRFSLQAGMGDWRPPPSSSSSSGGGARSSGRHTNMPPPSARPPKKGANPGNPPLGVTGVAPWAAQPSSTGASHSQNPPSTVTGVAPWAQSSSSGGGKNPPLTVTGVAPWAMTTGNNNKLPPPNAFKGPMKRPGAPPMASTPPRNKQVALRPPTQPQQQQSMNDNAGDNMHSAVTSSLPSSSITEEEEEETEEHVEESESKNSSVAKDPVQDPGLARVLHYMEQCKPPGMDEDEDENASSSWARAQMAETPTLLPDLKFHDLVFGNELGHGAFGVVKYARLIDRTKTRSHWPEYAVKIIATEKMKEMGYEYGVAREIACLHLVSHPNVARLVSSFRFQQGAYLVLEYASGGDLHQLLQQHGSLDVPSTQFVMGEVVAALNSLHEDLGFVYGDLKPENIVLSETGHVKLTDFGGCRPFTDRAKEMLKAQMGKSGKSLLETLREGDPRKLMTQQQQENDKQSADFDNAERNEEPEEAPGWMGEDDTSKKSTDISAINDDNMEVVNNSAEEQHKEDLRIEGTTAYLPPEVVLGSIPTPAADSWALGCVLYQCLSGRPPILEADEDKTRTKIVTFEHTAEEEGNGGQSQQHGDNDDPLFGSDQKHAADIPENAKKLIRSLLDRESNKRPNMQRIAQHDFFQDQDVLRLYQKPAYPLDVGDVAPGPPDAQWSRRQFSSIWAPQPHAYDISGTSNSTSGRATSNNMISAPIEEGEEALAPFSAMNFYIGSGGSSNFATSTAASSSSVQENDTTGGNQLAQIEEDDVSMASYNSETQPMQSE